MAKYSIRIFFLVASLDLIARLWAWHTLGWVTKPLLMSTLILHWWQFRSKQPTTFHNAVVIALSFSWLGDIFLMFSEQHPIFFGLGLGAFLIAHLAYTWRNLQGAPLNINTSKMTLFFGLFLLLYGSFLYQLILPNLGILRYPVLAYIAIILLMALTAFNRRKRQSTQSVWRVTLGASLFIISDSMIAINTFYTSFAQASFLIMLTYILAQYFIIKGLEDY